MRGTRTNHSGMPRVVGVGQEGMQRLTGGLQHGRILRREGKCHPPEVQGDACKARLLRLGTKLICRVTRMRYAKPSICGVIPDLGR